MKDILASYLGMKDKAVGIKINPSNDGLHPDCPKYFCQLVKEASHDNEYFIDINDLACPNSEITLGFRKPAYLEIEPRIKEEVKKIRIGKTDDADIILLILNGEQIMNTSILLGGISSTFKGEMGICGEAVARGWIEKKPSLSFLCNGARIMGQFRVNEMVLSIPKKNFDELGIRIKNLIKTGGSLCGCTVSDIPKEIIRGLKSAGFEKGADYFFGKINDISVRLYLNKDENGRFRQITVYIPIKGRQVHPNPPFQVSKREDWTDIWALFDPQGLGINLYTGKNIKDVIKRLVEGAFK